MCGIMCETVCLYRVCGLTTTHSNLRYGGVPASGVRGYGKKYVDTAGAECWRSQVSTREDSGSAG